MGKKLYVGNLPFTITDENLNEIFNQIGPVSSAKVIMDRDTGRSKGFGFVEMNNDDDAEKAISQFNGGELEGRLLKVNEARPMEPRAGGPRGAGPGGPGPSGMFRGNNAGFGGGRGNRW